MCDLRSIIDDVNYHIFNLNPHRTSFHSIHQVQGERGLPARRTSSGDHTVVETPVPIPNTVVKHSGPMIVRALAKVGIASFYAPAWERFQVGVFLCV